MMEVFAERRREGSIISDYIFTVESREIYEDQTADDVGLRPEDFTYTPIVEMWPRGEESAQAASTARRDRKQALDAGTLDEVV
jgi:hypothetical protein